MQSSMSPGNKINKKPLALPVNLRHIFGKNTESSATLCIGRQEQIKKPIQF